MRVPPFHDERTPSLIVRRMQHLTVVELKVAQIVSYLLLLASVRYSNGRIVPSIARLT